MSSTDALILKAQTGTRLFVVGQALVQVLVGRVAVLGKTVVPNDLPQRIVSPPNMSLIYLEALDGCEATLQLSSLRDGLEPLSHMCGTNGPIPFDGGLTFAVYTSSAGVPQGMVALDIPIEWDQLAKEVLNPPPGQLRDNAVTVAMICGPRKVGKSTFARFLVNNLLNLHSTVAVLDLDVGQAEFFPPGFVTLQLVHSVPLPNLPDACGPLFGPPYSHSPPIPTHSRFLGIIAADKSAALYLKAADELFAVYRQRYEPQGIPLVINTMGWVDGLGFALLQSLVHSFRPTHMLAIKPVVEDRNFGTGDKGVAASSPAAIAAASAACGDPSGAEIPEYVMEAAFGTASESVPYGGRRPMTDEEPIYIAAVRSGFIDQIRFPSKNPAVHRTALLAAYFHRISPMQYALATPLSELVPYCLPWASAAVLVAPSREHIDLDLLFSSLPLALVGLTPVAPYIHGSYKWSVRNGMRVHRCDLKEPLPECRGAGIIRAIDPIQRVFHILTPVPLTILHAEGLSGLVLRPGFLCPRALFPESWPDVISAAPGSGPGSIEHGAPYRNISSAYSASVLPNIRRLRTNLLRKSTSPNVTLANQGKKQ